MKTRWRLETGLVSLAVLAIGLGILWMTAQIPVAAAFAKIGPRAFPYTVGVMLIVLGALLWRDSWLRRWSCEATDPNEPRPDLVPLSWVGAGLLANIILIKPLGFILASTLMYVLVAHGFGARRFWLSALVGFGLALLAYFGFAELLGLRMGRGLIEDLL